MKSVNQRIGQCDIAYKYSSSQVLNREQFEEMLLGEQKRVSRGWTTAYGSKRFIEQIINNIHKVAIRENKGVYK
jgi:hypothetical protein